jgi:hypothetical protein
VERIDSEANSKIAGDEDVNSESNDDTHIRSAPNSTVDAAAAATVAELN